MSLLSFFKGLIKHPSTNLYSYGSGRNFANPGAGAFVFQPEFTNPTMLFRGAGRVAGSLSVFQGHVARANHAVPHRGIGGVQAGQIVFQGLSDPNALSDAATAAQK